MYVLSHTFRLNFDIQSIFGNKNVIKDQNETVSAESKPHLKKGIRTGEMRFLMGFIKFLVEREITGPRIRHKYES